MTDSLAVIADEMRLYVEHGGAHQVRRWADRIAALEAGAGGVVDILADEGFRTLQTRRQFVEQWRATLDGDGHDCIANRNTVRRFVHIIDALAAAPKASEAVAGTIADDLRLYGAAYEVDGVRIDPRRILIHIPQADPAPPAAPDEAMVRDAWQDKPDDKGWFWHFDGEEMRPLFVFPRPGHQYLAVQEEPNPVTGKRQFRMADRIGGKWLAIPVPKQPALTAALTGEKA